MSEATSNILVLGDTELLLSSWLQSIGESVIQTSRKISPAFIHSNRVEFLISYGYRHILTKDILDLLPDRAINLHIAYLPWNRGADPNLWSFVDDTPKGVTIHYLDEGIDTGDIILQTEITFDLEHETLATSYLTLQAAIRELFRKNWTSLKSGKCPRHKQANHGTGHKLRDRKRLAHLLSEGWDTPVAVLNGDTSE